MDSYVIIEVPESFYEDNTISTREEIEKEKRRKAVCSILPRTIIHQLLGLIEKKRNSSMKKAFKKYCKLHKEHLNQKTMRELLWGDAWEGNKKEKNLKEFRKFYIEDYLEGEYIAINSRKKFQEYLFFLPQLMKAAINKNAPKGFDCKERHQKNSQKQEYNKSFSDDYYRGGPPTEDDRTTAHSNSQTNQSEDNLFNQVKQNHLLPAQTLQDTRSDLDVKDKIKPFLTQESSSEQEQKQSWDSCYLAHENLGGELPKKEQEEDDDNNESSSDESNYMYLEGLATLYDLVDEDDEKQFDKLYFSNNRQLQEELNRNQSNGRDVGTVQEIESIYPESQNQNGLMPCDLYDQFKNGQIENNNLKLSNEIDSQQQSMVCYQQPQQQHFIIDPDKFSNINQQSEFYLQEAISYADQEITNVEKEDDLDSYFNSSIFSGSSRLR